MLIKTTIRFIGCTDIIGIVVPHIQKWPRRPVRGIGHGANAADPVDVVFAIAPYIGVKRKIRAELLLTPDHKVAVKFIKIYLVLGKVATMNAVGAGVLHAGGDNGLHVEQIPVER